ncbi:MAG: hypothetical protein NC191_00475 [Muribaculaceae bacterium]|nr:hypothetical protein [Muribaculaceae bacterium]
MVSVNRINNISFKGLDSRNKRNFSEPRTDFKSDKHLTCKDEYIDKRLKEQEQSIKKALDKQNALIGSSLVAMINYLNGDSDANSTRKLIQNKLIKKPEERMIEI